MNRSFENIDDLFQSKINELTDDDVLIREDLIWNKIETKLDKKPRLIPTGGVPLWWQYSIAACLLISLGFWVFTQSNFNKKTDISINPKSNLKPIIQPKSEQLKIEKTTLQKNIKSKKSTKSVESKSLEFEIKAIELNQNIAIENPEMTLKNIEFNSKNDLPTALTKTKNFRVIHIDEFNKKPIEIIKESKSFYVQFNSKFVEKPNQNSPFELRIPIKSSKF